MTTLVITTRPSASAHEATFVISPAGIEIREERKLWYLPFSATICSVRILAATGSNILAELKDNSDEFFAVSDKRNRSI